MFASVNGTAVGSIIEMRDGPVLIGKATMTGVRLPIALKAV